MPWSGERHVHYAKKGLDLPITGQPAQHVENACRVRHVASAATDFIGMKPRMHVQVGDRVRRGDPLFEDRKIPGVLHTALGGGKVTQIYRGHKRVLEGVVIELDSNEDEAEQDHRKFDVFRGGAADSDRASVQALLLESGLWTTLRTRPFSHNPVPGDSPSSIFVTAMDTQPLAADPGVIIEQRQEDWERGLSIVAKLTDGPTYLCCAAGSAIDPGDAPVHLEVFDGPHPAGTVGYHIHTLKPAHRENEVWHLAYADVLRIGRTFAQGTLDVSRIISLAGPAVQRPRLVQARAGATLSDLVADELTHPDCRVISGSVLNGRAVTGPASDHLGPYHLQVTAIEEGNEREFLGWARPGIDRFSLLPMFVSRLLQNKSTRFTTSTYGSPRAMVPIGAYERVMPMDLMPTHLLRALCMGDLEWAEALGVLELDEEDLALCTFVDPGKTDFGSYLRDVLNQLQAEA